jgi:hypothetical protein
MVRDSANWIIEQPLRSGGRLAMSMPGLLQPDHPSLRSEGGLVMNPRSRSARAVQGVMPWAYR